MMLLFRSLRLQLRSPTSSVSALYKSGNKKQPINITTDNFEEVVELEM